MTGYKIWLNPETKRYEVDDEAAIVDYDFEDYKRYSVVFNSVRGQAILEASRLNCELEEGSSKIVECKDCKKLFLLGRNEIEWFQEKGFSLPKRCPECRQKNKGERKHA